MTQWNKIYKLPEVADVARWELEARVVGATVEHLRRQTCHNFDSVGEGASPGVYRSVGRLRFNKRTRRWMAIVNSDCDAREATLVISAAVGATNHWGAKPGQKLRKIAFTHFDDPHGDPVAQARICYRLCAEDLLQMNSETLQTPDSIETLAHLVDEHYDELLREAGVDQ